MNRQHLLTNCFMSFYDTLQLTIHTNRYFPESSPPPPTFIRAENVEWNFSENSPIFILYSDSIQLMVGSEEF